MFRKLKNFFEDVRDAAIFIAGAPSALKLAGAFTKGVSSTIASSKVAKVVYQGGNLLTKSGNILGKYLSAGLKATAKTAKPIVTGVAKSIPGSKIIAPFTKFVPSALALYGIGSGLYNIAKQSKAISQSKGSALQRLGSTRTSFDATKPQDYLKAVWDMLRFK